jgi:hypothetical protein
VLKERLRPRLLCAVALASAGTVVIGLV